MSATSAARPRGDAPTEPGGQPRLTMTVGGKALATRGAMPIVNPATGQTFAHAPMADEADLDLAVGAARRAFPSWAARPVGERQQVLVLASKVLSDHSDELARLLTLEQGKPLADARKEIAGATHWLSQTARRDLPERVLRETATERVVVRHVAIGVVGAIVPWNFPLLLAAWKIAPAMLAGNTVILKPSPLTPLATLRWGELLRDVIPAGVLNVVCGSDSFGPRMTEHPGIDKISFTGSTLTGRKVMASAAARLKRLTLELGGNDAAIVMPDVDLSKVVAELFWGALINNGQTCIAAKRIYVHESIYDAFAAAFAQMATQVKIGSGLEAGVEIGPVQNKPQFERLLALLDDCRQSGHRFLSGGEPLAGPGYFLPVCVVDNPPDDSRIVVEEPFGPIVPLLKFKTVDEVVARANATEFGLAGSVWCLDERTALSIADRLQCGTVWINQIQATSPKQPMAGHKQSGFGIENGTEGLLEYTLTRTVSHCRPG